MIQVNDVVYMSYSPQQCGVVLEIIEKNNSFYNEAVIKWAKKGRPVTTVLCRQLKKLDNLIIEHKEKIVRLKGYKEKALRP